MLLILQWLGSLSQTHPCLVSIASFLTVEAHLYSHLILLLDEITPEIQLAVEEFRNFLENAIPVLIAHPDLREYVIREANRRLEQAKDEGVALRDISIGEDCLPTWPGLSWDPQVESLHCVLQSRLMDYQASRDLGRALRVDIIRKGNLKLQHAVLSGVSTNEISFGDRLLPVWTKNSASDTTNDSEVQNSSSSFVDDDSDGSSTAPDSLGDHSSIFDRDSQGSSDLPTAFDTSGSNNLDPNNWSSDSDSDSDSDSNSDSDDSEFPIEQTIVMNNFLNPEPEYSEPGTPTNILHGARLLNLGANGEETEVDLEVYVVDDEDEDILDELHEVELAIDRQAYEYHFDTTEAVDVAIPEMEICCVSSDSESVEESTSAIMFNPIPIIEEADDDDDDNSVVNEDSGVNDSSANNSRVVFEETEYGFRW